LGSRRFYQLIAVVAWLPMGVMAQAQAPEPLPILEGKGLQKSGNWLLLPEEVQFGQDLHEGYVKKSKLYQVQEQARRADASGQTNKVELARLVGQLAQLQKRLSSARAPGDRRNLIQETNSVTAKILGLQAADPEKKARQAWATATTLIGEFTETVLKLRRQYDVLLPRYDALARDPDVKAAIDRLNQSGEGPYALGPSTNQRKWLEGLESLVMADSVPIRRGRDGLWHVSVIVNGKRSEEMAIDSGASIVVLPMHTAQAAGITVGPGAPGVRMMVASGGQVEAKTVVAESLRVGRFVAENVECAVMPEQLKDAPALLGQSFLQRFRQTIDAGRGRWELASLQESGSQPLTPPPAPKPMETAAPNKPEIDLTEQLRRLLEVSGSDERAAKTAEVKLDDHAVTFHAGRHHEAAGLKQLFGEPHEIRKVDLPGHTDWELWTWGKVQVLVDPLGTTRYYAIKASQ
jgi:clan AA aspartic protease (TIGR02281 family)